MDNYWFAFTGLLSAFWFDVNNVTCALFCFEKGPGQFENLKYRFQQRNSADDSIKDVYDSKLYKMFSGPSGFLASTSNISLLGNTDGVALIRSSSYGVWPVFLVINELPPLRW